MAASVLPLPLFGFPAHSSSTSDLSLCLGHLNSDWPLQGKVTEDAMNLGEGEEQGSRLGGPSPVLESLLWQVDSALSWENIWRVGHMAACPWLGIVVSGSPEKAMEVISLRTYSPLSSPEIEAPYTSEEEQERLLGLYQYLHSRAHNASRPLKTIYYTGPNENLLAWVRWPWAGLDWASLGSWAGALGAA